jgi:prepilin-type N-terminal cleavage/methylation domain-containing protein
MGASVVIEPETNISGPPDDDGVAAGIALDHARSTCRYSMGFTLIEMMITVAIIAIIAALAVAIMPRFVRRAGVQASASDLQATLQEARSHALQSGRDTLVIIVGSAGNPDLCRRSPYDVNCVRWWMLEDVFAAAGTAECPGATRCTAFDAAALAAFDPANPAAGGPTLGGDIFVGSGGLDRRVTLGRPARAPTSLPPPLAGVDVSSSACTFCTGTTPPRGYVKFSADGTTQMSGLAGGAGGGAIYLQGDADTEEWRGIAITVPAGIISTRLWVL